LGNQKEEKPIWGGGGYLMLNNLQHNHLENEYLNPTQIDQNKDAKYQ